MEYGFGYYDKTSPEDIYGEDYYQLLERCFRYSRYFSLRFKRDFFRYPEEVCDSLEALDPYRFCSFCQLQDPCIWGQGEATDRLTIYYCNDETFAILREQAHSLFEWDFYNDRKSLPEDLTFYRDDGSVFFDQLTHEFAASLYPLAGEDVADIVSKNGWRLINGDARREFVPLSRHIAKPIPMTDFQKETIDIAVRYWEEWPQENINFFERQKACHKDDPEACAKIDKTITQLHWFAQEKERLRDRLFAYDPGDFGDGEK
ncbi:MAG: hypothetical protein ACOYJY_03920 [Acutalibacteraceae bacterium]